MTAAARWTQGLESWAIPSEILAAAPESPYGFDVSLFARVAEEAIATATPSQRIAAEALPFGGSVLDVGCGGGAGALPHAGAADLVIGVDVGEGMLAAFAERAAALGVDHVEHLGRWPDVADEVPVADVVVCHNVAFNVADLAPFAQALTEHARSRVVLELSQRHPMAWMNPYWVSLHGLDRPEGPTADDAAAVVRELGLHASIEHWEKSWQATRSDEEIVAFLRTRLCLGPDRDEEIRALLPAHPQPTIRQVATIWWDPPEAR